MQRGRWVCAVQCGAPAPVEGAGLSSPEQLPLCRDITFTLVGGSQGEGGRVVRCASRGRLECACAKLICLEERRRQPPVVPARPGLLRPTLLRLVGGPDKRRAHATDGAVVVELVQRRPAAPQLLIYGCLPRAIVRAAQPRRRAVRTAEEVVHVAPVIIVAVRHALRLR